MDDKNERQIIMEFIEKAECECVLDTYDAEGLREFLNWYMNNK